MHIPDTPKNAPQYRCRPHMALEAQMGPQDLDRVRVALYVEHNRSVCARPTQHHDRRNQPRLHTETTLTDPYQRKQSSRSQH